MMRAPCHIFLVVSMMGAFGCSTTLDLANVREREVAPSEVAVVRGSRRPIGYGSNVDLLAINADKASRWRRCYTAYVPPGRYALIVRGEHAVGLPRIFGVAQGISRISGPILFDAEPGREYVVRSSIGWSKGPLATHTLDFVMRDAATGDVVAEGEQWPASAFSSAIRIDPIIMTGIRLRALEQIVEDRSGGDRDDE